MKRLFSSVGGRIALRLMTYLVFALGFYGLDFACELSLGENYFDALPSELFALFLFYALFLNFLAEEFGSLIDWFINKVKSSRAKSKEDSSDA